MKKIVILLLLSVLMFASCSSTNIEYYSNPVAASNKTYLDLRASNTSVSTGGYGYTNYYGWTYVAPTSETASFGTIKEEQLIISTLQSKGYQMVGTVEEADIIVRGESTSDAYESKVTFGFYNKSTNQLMFLCEGSYGAGFGVQHDLESAIIKALESVPAVTVTGY